MCGSTQIMHGVRVLVDSRQFMIHVKLKCPTDKHKSRLCTGPGPKGTFSFKMQPVPRKGFAPAYCVQMGRQIVSQFTAANAFRGTGHISPCISQGSNY